MSKSIFIVIGVVVGVALTGGAWASVGGTITCETSPFYSPGNRPETEVPGLVGRATILRTTCKVNLR